MPIRVVFRARRSKGAFCEGGDNNPLGLTTEETIVRKYSFDYLNDEETVQQFVTRILGYVVTADPHPQLNRMPAHTATYVDYNMELHNDSLNGYRVYEENKAKGYDGQTLVVCYTNHN
jgi:hypothetical protein